MTLGDALEAKAPEVGKLMAGIARSVAIMGIPHRFPVSRCPGVKQR